MEAAVSAAIAELLHKREITDLLTRQFLYVDERQWDRLSTEVFAPEGPIMVDNGDGPRPSTAAEVIRGWQTTLSPLDAVYHQINQYIVTLTGENMAHAVAYGSATHYKASATQGRTRTFVGLYSFDLAYNIEIGWRIRGLSFTLKYMDGNLTLQ